MVGNFLVVRGRGVVLRVRLMGGMGRSREGAPGSRIMVT